MICTLEKFSGWDALPGQAEGRGGASSHYARDQHPRLWKTSHPHSSKEGSIFWSQRNILSLITGIPTREQ